MTHHLYGLFSDKTAACRAYHDLVELHGEHRCSVMVHESYIGEGDVSFGQTHPGRGAIRGAVLVGAAGAMIGGLIAGPAGILGLGPLAAAAFSGGVGGMYGALIGALSGTSDEDTDQFEQALREGKVLVAVKVANASEEDAIGSILREHGARLVRV